MSKRRVELSGEGGEGLTHNPFAALRGGSAKATGSSGQVDPTAPPASPTGPPASRADGADGAAGLAGSEWLVRKEKKGRGGKVVTIVSPRSGGSEPLLVEVARSLGQRLGTGARAKGGEIIVQGELSDRVRVLLLADGARVTVGS